MSHTCGITGRRQELPCINCDCESSDRPDGSKVPTDEEMERDRMVDEIDYMRGLVIRLRGGMQELYALRGEDDLVARICDPLIEATRDF